ncbi:MAG: hypothetical protein GX349_06225 [Firmicutes bacterium]|nr:hypothetical protein [Bacillota bacterium]
MTHSLHRVGTLENLKNDHTIIAMPAKGINHVGSVKALRRFIELAAQHKPSNFGLITCGNVLKVPPEEMIRQVNDGRAITVVFDNIDNFTAMLKQLKEEDLGLSVTCGGIYERTLEACKRAGLEPDTLNHSLGVFGRTDKLPRKEILEFTTMCGHHQIAAGLVEKMLADVKARKITPEDAALSLGKHCPCGFFNVTRARDLFEEKLAAAAQ